MERFLSLCDPHNSIIHDFGCEGSCTRPAAICLRGCNQYQHQQKASRHEFLQAKEFYSLVGSIRQRYDTFRANFREVYLRRYMEEVTACVNSFQEYILGEFLEKTPIIDIFSKYSSGGDAFQQLIEEPLDQVEFAEVRCRDVFQLRHFEQTLQREGPEEEEKRMMKLLSKIFEHHLRTNKILLSQKSTQERRLKAQDMVEADKLDALAEALQRKATNLEYSQRQEKVEELLLILHSDLKDYEKSSHSTESLSKLYNNLQNYMEKTLPERIVLAVNFPLTVNPFWERFCSFIGNKGLKQVAVWTTAAAQAERKMEGQMGKRHEGLLPIVFRYNAHWDDVSVLMDKKPSRTE